MKHRKTFLQRSLAALGIAGLALMADASHAIVVGSATLVDFTGSATTFGFGGASFTLSDNLSGIFDPVSVRTGDDAAVRTVFGTPSVDFQVPIVYGDDGFIQYGSFPQDTLVRFSGTPSSLGLRVTLEDGVHFGYAWFSGTLLQSYGFETTPGLGIVSGTPPTTPVPEPAGGLLLAAGLLALGVRGARGRAALLGSKAS